MHAFYFHFECEKRVFYTFLCAIFQLKSYFQSNTIFTIQTNLVEERLCSKDQLLFQLRSQKHWKAAAIENWQKESEQDTKQRNC